MMRSIAKFFGLTESDLENESAGGLAITILLLPFRLLWGFIYFMIFSWTTSRSGRAFFLSVPAMIGFTGYVALVWAIGFKGDNKAVAVSKAYYQLHVDPSSPIFDPEAAKLFATKVVQEAPEEERAKYDLGVAYEANKEYELALNVMNWIAPLESEDGSLGYANAHLWLATYYDRDKLSDLPEDERDRLSRTHLELASKADPENVFAVLGLATKSREDFDRIQAELAELDENSPEGKQKAAELDLQRIDSISLLRIAIALELVSERQLYANVALVEMLLDEDDPELARIEGRQFINKHIRSARVNPDILPFWISIVKVCILINDFDRGEEFIIEGFQLAQNPEVRNTLAQLAAQIDIEKSRTFEDMENEQQYLSRLNAVANAIKTDVKVPQGYVELMYFVDGFEDNSDQDFWLRDSVLGIADSDDSNLDPRLPGVLHVIIGFRDILSDNKLSGQNHWETAGEQFPLAPFAINYLIQAYSQERDLDHDRKQELISVAIEMFPQSPNFYLTRGRFLIAAEKHLEALEDLEFAEARLPANISLFENILKCQEALGNQEKIDEYEDKIVDLETEMLQDEISTGFTSSKIEIRKKDDEKEDDEKK